MKIFGKIFEDSKSLKDYIYSNKFKRVGISFVTYNYFLNALLH